MVGIRVKFVNDVRSYRSLQSVEPTYLRPILVIEGAGHALLPERPQETATAVLRFL